MSGHSKWSSIKHKKAITDSRRGKAFSKIVKEISVAARIGGADPALNPRLRLAVDKAKDVNMPGDNIKRAIQKGTGDLEGAAYEEYSYEGYGPGGIALYIEVLTDNKNRTVSEIRHAITKHGGSLGESGCVAWMFKKSGLILVGKKETDEDNLMGIVLDAGADDLKSDPDDETYEVITTPEAMHDVRQAIEEADLKVELAEVSMLPENYVEITSEQAQGIIRLMEALEDLDDVQNVYSNFDVKN